MVQRQSLERISPFFIVSDVPSAITFYQEQLGFEPRILAPEAEPFFAVVGRDSVEISLKHLSEGSRKIDPQPNHTRHPWAPWDAFVLVKDPDSLAAELSGRGVAFHRELLDRDDGLRGFEVRDLDGYVLFFGRPT